MLIEKINNDNRIYKKIDGYDEPIEIHNITKLKKGDVLTRHNFQKCELLKIANESNGLEFWFKGFVVNRRCMSRMFFCV